MVEKFVAFKSGGIKLAGVLHLPGGQAKKVPGIVIFHGFLGTRFETGCVLVKASRYFANHGFGVLRFDFRGSGDSEGDYLDTTLPKELTDAENAVKFIMKQKEIDASRIAIAGLSMGGAITACTAYKFREIKTAVLWNPLAYMAHVNVSIRSRMGNPRGRLKYPLDVQGWRISKKFVESLEKIDPLEDIKKFSKPVFVICGSKDTSIPPAQSGQYMEAIVSQKKKITINGADHTFTKHKDQVKVFSLTSRWIKSHTL